MDEQIYFYILKGKKGANAGMFFQKSFIFSKHYPYKLTLSFTLNYKTENLLLYIERKKRG
jgi:hypothetical protein